MLFSEAVVRYLVLKTFVGELPSIPFRYSNITLSLQLIGVASVWHLEFFNAFNIVDSSFGGKHGGKK